MALSVEALLHQWARQSAAPAGAAVVAETEIAARRRGGIEWRTDDAVAVGVLARPEALDPGSGDVAWLAGGREQDGFIHWGQPEIVLYHDEFPCGSSYPDFVETGDGSLSIVSTQKTEARVVDVDPQLLNGLWSAQARVPLEGLVLDLPGWQPRPSSEAVPPQGGGELPRRRGRSPAGSPRRTPAGRTRSPGCLGRAIT